MDDASLKADIVAEAEFDVIEFGHAMYVVKTAESPSLDAVRLLDRAGPLVVDLVREGRLVPGNPTADGTFAAWDMDPQDASDRIARELTPIYRRATAIVPGEICFFTHAADPSIVRISAS